VRQRSDRAARDTLLYGEVSGWNEPVVNPGHNPKTKALT
jgi:hypothetical protein